MKLLRILCLFNKHSFKKRVRHYAPALGREEMYCTRCGKHYLVPLDQPRSRMIFKHGAEDA